MKIISVCNNKGGVGKTAVSMALCELLNSSGHKTLLIDLDQQINATKQAGVKTEGVVTAYDLLTSFEYTAKDGIQEYDHGYIIPGDILVNAAEVEISKLDTSLTMLADALESVKNDFEYVIIDCPPSLGLVTRNAFVASDELIVVIIPDKSSIDGFARIVDAADHIKKNKRLNPDLKIAGILINSYNARGRLDKEVDEVLPELALQADTSVFNTRIRRNISVSQALSSRESLFDYDDKSAAAMDLRCFVKEFLNKESKVA